MTITEIREKTNMNMTQFADWLNIPYRTLQNWELGIRQCPQYLIDLIEFKVWYHFEETYDDPS